MARLIISPIRSEGQKITIWKKKKKNIIILFIIEKVKVCETCLHFAFHYRYISTWYKVLLIKNVKGSFVRKYGIFLIFGGEIFLFENFFQYNFCILLLFKKILNQLGKSSGRKFTSILFAKRFTISFKKSILIRWF